LEGVGYGFLIPIFFLMSGVKFNLGALLASPLALALLPAFLALFFVIRGLPAFFLFRHDLSPRGRTALGLFAATQLPLVIAISNLGVESGQMTVEVASSLVGAGMLSMLLYPVFALALRRNGGAASSRTNAVHTSGRPTA
jgi:Kef-type K+ transport system membrane component KefB